MEQTCYLLQVREFYAPDQVVTIKATRAEVKTIAQDMSPESIITWSLLPDGLTEVGFDSVNADHVFTITEHIFTV